jgi:uncharacterized phage-associated protein
VKLINKEFEKRKNAILYFCKTVKYPFKTKIYKLLYFLDFIHFKQTGRPVTDLEYYAFEFGPVPLKLHKEISKNEIPEELKSCLEIFKEKDETTGEEKYIKFIPKLSPNLDVFTEREKEILEKVATIFKDAQAKDMTEVTHLKNEPWDKTKKEKGMYKKIDFLLALDKEALVTIEMAKERMRLSKEMKELFE